ncbi:MAG: hypothetical protein JXA46_11920 [Dehalococcoidales bacterium]|nr:hypothetical protein [Dehalococcoidales bacterium]
MKKIFLYMIMALVCVLVLAGCNSSSETTTTATSTTNTPGTTSTTSTQTATSTTSAIKTGGTFKYIVLEGPSGALGYLPDLAGQSARFLVTCLENLYSFDFHGTPRPILATKWDIDASAPSITFTLREGVKFHDGTDFNAEAVKWNLETVKAANVKGSEKWESFQVVNDHKIVVNLTTYDNSILGFFSEASCMMTSPTAFETMGGIEGVRWNPVGTGPFKFKEFKRDSYVEFEKNTDYWEAGHPYLDGVKFVIIADSVTASMSFRAEEGHAIFTISGGESMAAELEPQGYNIEITSSMFTMLVADSANTGSPFSNVKVREATEYAIDRDKIAKSIGRGYWVAINQPASSLQDTYIKDFQGRSYDPDKAKTLLTEAGYPNGFETTIIVGTHLTGEHITTIQSYLAAVGIKTNIEEVSVGRWLELLSQGWENGIMFTAHGVWQSYNYTACVERYYIPDAVILSNMAKPTGILELRDKLYSSDIDYDTYFSTIQDIIRLVHDEAIIIPLWDVPGINILHSTVRDLGINNWSANFRYDWNKAWLDK